MNKLKSIPKFNSEEDEKQFWLKNDSSEYIDWSQAIKNPQMPKLKPSTQSISLRLPENLLNDIKMIANQKDIPYQSLMKVYLSEKVKKEINQTNLLP